MCKKLFLLTLLISLVTGVSSSADPVGIFENATDIDSAGIGSTLYEGYVWNGDVLSEQYFITAGGGDVWGNSDQFHFAYNTISGDVRISASFDWVCVNNDWAKYGVMLRESLDGNSVHRFMADRKNQDYAGEQGRTSTGAGSGEWGTNWTSGAQAMGIQRVTVEGLTVIEALADFGSGWESRRVELVLNGNLEGEILAGVASTSHDNNIMAQCRVWNVVYEENPSLVGELSLTTVPASADLGVCPSDVPGFSIRALKPLVSDGWGFDAMNELLDTGMYMGLPAMPGSEGTRIDEFVNVRDTGNGAFSEDNGYPDAAYPGIDPDEVPAQDPAAGDDDDTFAVEILGYIQLTAGIHQIGSSHDDGIWVEIGGVEVVSNDGWGGPHDYIYKVEADGCYDLRARHLEGGGGAHLELHEIFLDGTRILLNDVANGGSAVFAPAL
jgi:hypothetical protein